ncbi:MAG: hypothetical protein ABI643_01000 [Candidatus Doudnabacteria bacterium]
MNLGAEIKSISDDLTELGIVIPKTSHARVVIWNFLLGPMVPPEVRSRRLQEFTAFQDSYLGKKIRRKLEPDVVGIVDHIRPITGSSFGRSASNQSQLLSAHEAYVKWVGKKTGAMLRLDQIELLLDP